MVTCELGLWIRICPIHENHCPPPQAEKANIINAFSANVISYFFAIIEMYPVAGIRENTVIVLHAVYNTKALTCRILN